MYHLAKALYLHLTSKPEYSILLLGLDNAGKTTLHEQIKALPLPLPTSRNRTSNSITSPSTTTSSTTHHPNLKTVPTVGQNVSTVDVGDAYLRIWDVGGQHSLRGLWESYYKSAHAIVYVVDSTDIGDGDIAKLSFSASASASSAAGRLDECRVVLEEVLQNEDAEGVPLLVLANKQDREDCVEVVRIKEGFVRKVIEGEKGGSVRDSRVLPCSALTGTGVQEAVEWLCSRVKWNKEARPPVMR
ncbi:P-loop containing nucleoside triphosphate hydrolase protein [Viridothelium virens]|uniref:P-loop containing nucleoside triphosphate hydrolase protein n=1 Tax=Viridothelium virens TaxID=1048519 RepID=A0A6A6GXL7_VIRVR|nr:P-loop containing nucleoside triphosphate hydrolase protein [Viridothelium virens]